MIGVTIGIGEGWTALARQAAQRMSWHTGLKCHVIETAADFPQVAHPSWLKCHIPEMFPEADSFLIFDADILPLREWDPHGLFEQIGRAFCAVPEPNGNPDILAECRDWGLGFPDIYVNGGLILCGREHDYIWQRTWQHHPAGGRWAEQTALNYELADTAVEVCRLPRCFNALAQMGRINPYYSRVTLADAVNLHCCALHSAPEVSAMHQQVEAYVASGFAARTRQQLLANLPQGSRGAELGVFRGEFSRDMLRVVNPAELYLVDLFDGPVTSGDCDGRNLQTVDMSTMPEELSVLGPRVYVKRSSSTAFLTNIIDSKNLLDWVYIDTSHDYETTVAELALARRAVHKSGGIIAGHDYSRAFPGVLQAVTEFAIKHELVVDIYDGDLLPSYAMRNVFPRPDGAPASAGV